MKSKRLLIVVIVLHLKFITSTDNEKKMIADIIKSYVRPTSILANLCWSPSKKKELISYLGQLEADNQPRTIRFIDKRFLLRDYRQEHVMFVVDINCPDVRVFLEKANSSTLFANPCRWLILGESNNEDKITIEMEHLNILPDSEVIISQCTGNIYTLNLIYKVKQNDIWRREPFGNWVPTFGLYKLRDMYTSHAIRRKNFNKQPITTTMIAQDNRTMDNLYDLNHIEIDTVSKANFRHTEPLYDFMNATRINKFTKNWGYFVNGSWNGIVGHFVRGEADISASVMFMTQQRLNVIKFISYPTNIKVQFVFREPPLSSSNNLFLMPFTTVVWLCIGGFTLMLMFIVYINAYWEMIKYDLRDESSDPKAVRADISDIAVLIISAMCQQGSAIELKGTVGRIVTFLLFLTFLFLYTSYSASIVALLQSSSNQIRTLSDLYHSNLELGLEDLPYNTYFFSVATEPLRKAIFQNKIAPRGRKPNYFSLEEGIRRLQTKPFAFNMNIGVGYRLVNKYFQEHEKCGLQEINFLQDNKAWLSCPKTSPYVEIFKVGLQRSSEHGLIDRVNQMVYVKKPVCSVRGGRFVSVDILDVYPVLIMFAYGIMISIIFLMMEILVHRKQNIRRKSHD